VTGTQVAALRLALGVLRWRITAGHDNKYIAKHDFSEAWRVAAGPGRSSAFGWFDPREWWSDDEIPWRILRARLALTIRALLRAERGDFGAVQCNECGDRFASDAWAFCQCRDWLRREWGDGVPFRPLWTLARAHGGRT